MRLIFFGLVSLLISHALADEPLLPTPAEATEIVPLLQKNYWNPTALKTLHGPSTLPALWPTLRGVSLLPTPEIPNHPVLHTEVLPGHIGYWRVAGFTPAHDWNTLTAELQGWENGGSGQPPLLGLILDLRSTGANLSNAENDFAGAARIASYFVPENQLLFSIQGLQVPQQLFQSTPSNRTTSAQLPLIVLINRQTSGAAEALANTLRRDAGAILVGRSTPGDAAFFTETRLSSGRTLRVASAPVLLPDGNPLLGHPISPDVAVYVNDQTEAEALAQIDLGPASHGLVEAPIRHRMNEASLVHAENPEIDEALAEQAREARGDDPSMPLRDLTLMRAVDMMKGIALFPAL